MNTVTSASSLDPDTSNAGSDQILLDVDDVWLSVNSDEGTVNILRGMSLQARAGEVTALLGPNGAGKTTTLSIAQGLVKPSAGRVRLLGQDPFTATAALRSQVGVMLQDGGLPPSVTPLRLIEHLAHLYREPLDIYALINRLEITEFQDRTIRRLSGGQQQRVAMAAALIGRPSVIFLDEPSAGLDPVSRRVVFELIQQMKHAGLAIVLTTHLLDDAEKLADRVILINHGRVEREGTVAELTDHHDRPAVLFSVETPLSDHALADVPEALSVHRVTATEATGMVGMETWQVRGLQEPADYVELTRWWQRWDILPRDLSMSRRSLEDVFWEVTP